MIASAQWAAKFICPTHGRCTEDAVTTAKTCLRCKAGLIRDVTYTGRVPDGGDMLTIRCERRSKGCGWSAAMSRHTFLSDGDGRCDRCGAATFVVDDPTIY